MTRSLSKSRAEADLAGHAPALVDGYLAALPEAADTVGRRLRGALTREGIRDCGPGRRHAFNRVEYPTAGAADPDAGPAVQYRGPARPATTWQHRAGR